MWVTGIIIKGDCDRFLEASIDYVSSVGMLTDCPHLCLMIELIELNTVWTPFGIIRSSIQKAAAKRRHWYVLVHFEMLLWSSDWPQEDNEDGCWEQWMRRNLQLLHTFFTWGFWLSYDCFSAANVSYGCYWLYSALLIYTNKMNDNRIVKLF